MTILIVFLAGLLIPVAPGESIQDALDSSTAGDTVLVLPGVHTGSGENLITMNGSHNGVVLLGDPQEPSTTVLSGTELSGGIMRIDGMEAGSVDSTTIISGLAFSNGSSGTSPFGGAIHTSHASPVIEFSSFSGCEADNGGAIYSWKGAPTIRYSTFYDNECESAGAGIYLYTSQAVIENCRFNGNHSWDDGGAVYLYHSSPVIFNCIFTDNYAHDDGGGIYCYALSSPYISFCTFTGNFALYTGSAVYFRVNSSPLVSHCIATANVAPAFYLQDGGNPVFEFNCVWGNPDGNYGNLPDPTGTGGNISEDPLLTGDGFLAHIAAGQAADSPCIDAGAGSAQAFALEETWTRTDSVPDSLTVDLGFHHSAGCGWQSTHPEDTPGAFTILPNPATTEFTVVQPGEGSMNAMNIYDISGRLVFFGGLSGESTTFTTGSLSTGTYLVQVRGPGGYAAKPLTVMK